MVVVNSNNLYVLFILKYKNVSREKLIFDNYNFCRLKAVFIKFLHARFYHNRITIIS